MNLLRLLFGLCDHGHVSWPQGKGRSARQRCLDCTRSRSYIIPPERYGVIKRGRWEQDGQDQRKQEVFVLEKEGR